MLCLSGHDPGGGAGLQADIETLAAHGVHALGVITALTVQDSRDVRRVIATDPVLLREQLDCLHADIRPHAIKIGLIGGTAQLPLILEAIHRCAVPVVCDPVLRAGGGSELVAGDFASALLRTLLPSVTILTPNAAEARHLASTDDLDHCGRALLTAGCANVLVTGGDEAGTTVVNTWHRRETAAPQRYEWPRLQETFHGAGCTLASAIAARLALGDSIEAAVSNAQAWTQDALRHAFAVGSGRRIPGRIHP